MCCNCDETPGNSGNTNENLDLQEDENFEAIHSWLPSILGVQKSLVPRPNICGPSIRNSSGFQDFEMVAGFWQNLWTFRPQSNSFITANYVAQEESPNF